MPHALITTKLRPPRTRPNLVARPRLREALDRSEGRRLTLVSAPAGFGKTTLLAEWLEERSEEKAVAWVSLEGSDNDPARFLSYLVGALQGVKGGRAPSKRLSGRSDRRDASRRPRPAAHHDRAQDGARADVAALLPPRLRR